MKKVAKSGVFVETLTYESEGKRRRRYRFARLDEGLMLTDNRYGVPIKGQVPEGADALTFLDAWVNPGMVKDHLGNRGLRFLRILISSSGLVPFVADEIHIVSPWHFSVVFPGPLWEEEHIDAMILPALEKMTSLTIRVRGWMDD